jgi:tetratricopeptide (TPR) repeat protein
MSIEPVFQEMSPGKKPPVPLLLKAVVIVISISALLFFCINLVLAFRLNTTTAKLAEAQRATRQSQELCATAQTDKDRLVKENEKMQADITSYLAVTTKMQKDKEALEKILSDSQKKIEAKTVEAERFKQRLKKADKMLMGEGGAVKKRASREEDALKKRLADLEASILKERAQYNYNLAVAYARAEMYDEAIDTYERSLSYDKNNADAHYNLGVLYDTVKGRTEEAIAQYKEYLALQPDASDREEVEASIKRLSGE